MQVHIEENTNVSTQPVFEKVSRLKKKVSFVSCRRGTDLAKQVFCHYLELNANKTALQTLYDIDFEFSDKEICAELKEEVHGSDVFLFQSVFDPGQNPNHNYLAFFISARMLRTWGAKNITGIVPYLVYSRQDKPSKFKREPVTSRLFADFSTIAGLDGLITLHPHSDAIRGFYNIPIEILNPLGLLFNELRHYKSEPGLIIVAPDAGVGPFVVQMSQKLELPYAIAVKHRPEKEKAIINEIVGDFNDMHSAIIVDDMIGTGGTICGLVKKLTCEKGIKEVSLLVTHNLCMEKARFCLEELYEKRILKQMWVTNSIPQTEMFRRLPFVKILDISEIIAQTIYKDSMNCPIGLK